MEAGYGRSGRRSGDYSGGCSSRRSLRARRRSERASRTRTPSSTATTSLYVGRPIIEAHRLEEDQQWAGAALTASACDRIPQTGHPGELARWYSTPWEVPIKKQEPLSTLAVNWNRGVHAPEWRLRWSPTSALPPEPRSSEEQGACEKFLNTKRFHEAHCRDCTPREA
jgi:hypothetical protein